MPHLRNPQPVIAGNVLSFLKLTNHFCTGIGIDGKSKKEVILLKKTGKVKALEDDIDSQKDSLNLDVVHNVHVGISHTRYVTLSNPAWT